MAPCISPPGYSAVDRPRPDGSSYGGIVIFHRSHLSVRRIPLASSPTTFEALALSVSSPRGPLTILAAYRPGSTSPSSLFFHEFVVLLEQFALYNAQLVITGDLNLHLEDPSLPASSEFHTIIDQFGLTQHVAEPTHKAGGWLDVVLSLDDCIPTDVRVYPPTASDHGLVTATIPFLCDTPSYLIRQVRDWRNLDRAAFGSAQLYSRFQPLLIHPSRTIFQLQMSLQPTNRRWRKSLKGSCQPARRGSVVADSRHGSTQNVGPCVVKPVVWRDCTGAPGHLPIALRGWC